jgi:hypothetical protein
MPNSRVPPMPSLFPCLLKGKNTACAERPAHRIFRVRRIPSHEHEGFVSLVSDAQRQAQYNDVSIFLSPSWGCGFARADEPICKRLQLH